MEKPFNFLDFIKNPNPTDEIKSELEQKIYQLDNNVANKNNTQIEKEEKIDFLENESEKNQNDIEINDHKNDVNKPKEPQNEIVEIDEIFNLKNLEKGEKLKQFNEDNHFNPLFFEYNLKIIKENEIHHKEINLHDQDPIKSPIRNTDNELELIKNLEQRNKEIDLEDKNLANPAFKHQKNEYEEEFKEDENFPLNINFEEAEEKKSDSPDQLDPSQKEKEINSDAEEIEIPLEKNSSEIPKMAFGHSLEEIIYNVNNLRSHLNALKKVSQDVGIDPSYIEGLDKSFSTALENVEKNLERNENEDYFKLVNAMIALEKEEQQKQKEKISKFKTMITFLLLAKNFIFNTFHKIKNFVTNSDNLMKAAVLILSFIFFAGFRQIPEFEKDSGEIFDWLAYNKNAKTILFSGTLIWGLLIYLCFKTSWIFIFGSMSNPEKKKIHSFFLDFNPFMDLLVIFMIDSEIISNRFDLAIWVSIFVFFTILNAFLQMCSGSLKWILSNAQQHNIANDYIKIRNIYKMICLVFMVNNLTVWTGLYLFYYSSFFILSLLFYQGILILIESLKNLLIITKLEGNMEFYFTNNHNEIKDPFFFIDICSDVIGQFVKIFHYLQLSYIYLYFAYYPTFVQYWFLYFLKEIQSAISHIKRNYDDITTFRDIINNLNHEFPQVNQDEIIPDEMCSICHENLLVSRKLQCKHRFHMKCLFYWLKTQNKTNCPVCRAEIANINFLRNRNRSFFYKIIAFISSFTDFNIRFIAGAPVPQNDVINNMNN